MDDSNRVAYAWVAAPLTAVFVAAIVASVIGLAGYAPAFSVEWIAAVIAIIVAFELFGAPLAMAMEMFIGGPAYYLLTARKHTSSNRAMCIATLAGAATFTGVVAAAFATCGSAGIGAIGAAAGASVGGLLWLGCVRRVPGRPQHS